ncbi:sugar phosphate isomerase/epimerase family protein [Lignipirellula cremea]|uniref:Inosose dehydratase n=1 Tax=Lignipirellula cremea TaxID=2528010 RepID=A0A518E520_9BACT|nr:sugar phosphate isomerase/epimerase [Lignipirellula cremea]QDU99195.1 Inosose dehydratase [Lignipirellula cremea]
MKFSRRETLGALAAAATAPMLQSLLHAAEAAGADKPQVATNTYPWSTFARREGQPLVLHSNALLAEIARTGITGYEPIIDQPGEFEGLVDRLQKHGLVMSSIYVNSTLHDPAQTKSSIAQVLAIADAAAQAGVKIIVTNPSPVRWGGAENKTDEQLRLQARSLDQLGRELRDRGLTLAYHNHDAELRAGAREFHHMLTATSPEHVKFCLDAHWVFRGCGDSEVAVFDALAHYQERIVELHLRQSTGGVWDEAFAMQGDIDYARLLKVLAKHDNRPHLVLEQAVEAKSSRLLTAVEAHRQSYNNLVS